MFTNIVIELKIDPCTHHHVYRARLDANYCLSVTQEAIDTDDIQSMIESELKMGLSNVVYGDIVKEMRQVIEACSELKSVRTPEYSDSVLLRDQIKKLENCINNIMDLCVFE